MDGSYSKYSRCSLCPDVTIIKYTTKSGIAPLKGHTANAHPDFDPESFDVSKADLSKSFDVSKADLSKSFDVSKADLSKSFDVSKADLSSVYTRKRYRSVSEDSSDGETIARERAKRKKYIPKSREEIIAALNEIAQNEEATDAPSGSRSSESILTGTLTGTIDSNNSSTDSKQKLSPTWNYFKRQGENDSGNPLFACLFCSFIGSKNVSIFKAHLLYLCPGVPCEIRESIKSDLRGSRRGYKYDKKKSNGEGRRRKRSRNDIDGDCQGSVGNSTRDPDSDSDGAFYETNGDTAVDGMDTEQVVAILSKLLSTPVQEKRL